MILGEQGRARDEEQSKERHDSGFYSQLLRFVTRRGWTGWGFCGGQVLPELCDSLARGCGILGVLNVRRIRAA
jgi:hypothetical protein